MARQQYYFSTNARYEFHLTQRMNVSAPVTGADEPASVDELRALQLERLQWTLRHAYENVPFYRKAFDAAGLHPGDCQSLGDLARLLAGLERRQRYSTLDAMFSS